ncbi:SDR family NAD(P)-dependent oxidoreductase [Sulfitobacter donghicola]|uniref:3-oxoacyl-ACP reductase n=1 Tax=Sulfitobacter donghicola DSW-25 = KCTC 12864 = JCM 14565 TaxID=1300350 RepID=A0A073IHC1_9RHOB|nr:SDR family oxidoreductase [Sulfitobacter donghicola]KEJ88945.1 3-oxoacyl-ACP reductase [Sulfitobacter donghicola DSW-25 = KCTC 12864 = JCM 14565]KIN67509.1 3-oxoacyl-(acyl-carrier protein) reductase [Sulfitobacter donghicola DSW-25 = KCTC 12864 = JCM 14565]
MTQNAIFPDLKDKSVFITGGGSGIGAFLTDGFMKQGANVSFVQRSDASAFCDEMEAKHGRRPFFQTCDISDIPALKQCLAKAAAHQGPITALINNAANDARHATQEVTEEFWDQSQAINLKSYFFACQAVIDGMRTSGGGAIVNMTSISYMMGNTGYPSYTTANSGINGMTRSLAREFGPEKIRVNALAPGWVLTDKQKEQWVTPEAIAAHVDRQCLKETLAPEDIVDAVLFLSSNASRMMTGQSMVVDGGVVVSG